MITNNIIFPEFLTDAFMDSVKLVPFLFVIFVLIELFEHKYSRRIIAFMRYAKKYGPIVGAFIAIIPQCGFSVVASTLFIKRYISPGTLIAVFIATSDEAIPVLISDISNITVITNIIILKLLFAIPIGYLTDFLFKDFVIKNSQNKEKILIERGCCNHDIVEEKHFLYHPIIHTVNIFLFIFATCIFLNYVLDYFGIETVRKIVFQGSFMQPVLVSLIALIPNCSASVFVVMLYLEHTITFGSLMAGLSSGAGLGLLVLLKKNSSPKETGLLVIYLLIVSIIIGIIVDSVSLLFA